MWNSMTFPWLSSTERRHICALWICFHFHGLWCWSSAHDDLKKEEITDRLKTSWSGCWPFSSGWNTSTTVCWISTTCVCGPQRMHHQHHSLIEMSQRYLDGQHIFLNSNSSSRDLLENPLFNCSRVRESRPTWDLVVSPVAPFPSAGPAITRRYTVEIFLLTVWFSFPCHMDASVWHRDQFLTVTSI